MKKILLTISSLIAVFSSAQTWNTAGNSGTNSSTDFLGTIDAQPLIFRTNNSEKVRITLNGSVGVGTSNPTQKLDVNGSVIANERYNSGNDGSYYIKLNSNGYNIPIISYLESSGNTLFFGNPGGQYHSKTIIQGGNGDVVLEPHSASSAFVVKAESGNVGVGTTTPDNVQNWDKVLDIYASAHSKLLVRSLNVKTGIFSHETWGGAVGRIGTESNHDLRLMAGYGNDVMTLNTIGNVGIGNITPQAKLDVSGDVRIANIPTSTSSTDQALVVDAQGFVKRGTITNSLQSNNIYNNILYYHSGCAVINNGVKIKTNIPFPASGSGGEMPTVNIEGFAYGESKTIGININWYVWQNEFYLASNVSSYGGYTPIVKLANENGKVVIFLDDKTYCINFGVKAIGGGDPSYYQGWTIADEPITGSITKTLAYKNAFGNVKVDGKLEAKEIKVTLTPTADFVFEKEYGLPKLEEVEKFVKENKHLPEIASAKEMEKEGVNVGEFQIKLLQKIEELTLYSIDLNKKNKEQEALIKSQTDILKSLNKRLEKIEKTKQK
ncbi:MULTISPECIES: hypothetical protein [unclassified Chryseobacterium]|uniref:hypothetical protein n=1 Tax=unclassified Chryseobacterium TaxID=2593645 RepID=UPI001E562ED9|nr:MULTISPECIES: hypothetical protein [unclassified Chryseobacterium]